MLLQLELREITTRHFEWWIPFRTFSLTSTNLGHDRRSNAI